MAEYYWSERRIEEDDEDEALSLSDLPTYFPKTEATQTIGRGSEKEEHEGEPEFDFGWWRINGPSASSESHMSAADELFFKGQILPRWFSISSDNGRSATRSETVSLGSSRRLIGSCRSSSIGSYTSSSSSTNSSSATARASHQKRPLTSHHLIHTRPSPKSPSINALSDYYSKTSKLQIQNNDGFSLWDFFRTGIIRGPSTDIELRDIKFRGQTNNSRNAKRNQKGLLFHKNNMGLLFGGVNCRCSVETVPVGNFVARRGGRDDKVLRKDSTAREKGRPMMTVKENRAAVSRLRTSEWLKELSLSHAR
ncbi:hypothetical protein SAY86_030815 [Trapa natans]|uniref:Uncharacterized protein n=1 Tax=Trapa natans TaxID=22666 RepID=A0AAN7M4C2_TRANT|nr:hypothetical protein SAY86_030815 [Trapa natans]